MFKFEKFCPICHKSPSYEFDVTYEQVEKYKKDYNLTVQEAFPDLPPDEREVFVTGMCFDCQSRVFQ